MLNAPLRPARDGAFASCAPRTEVLAGAGALVASDPDGIAVALFGWADPATGKAANERTSSQQLLGFVLPVGGTWQRIYFEQGRRYIRPGLPVTLCSRGDFWVRFPGGAITGQRVYTDPVDGSVISGYAAGAELTPWSVITNADPGNLAIISSWSKFSP